MEFKDVLRELRLERGLSQKKLGAMLFTIDTTVTNWEKGRAEPNIDTLKRIAQIFEVSMDYLCGRSAQPDVVEYYARTPIKKEENDVLQYFGMLNGKNKLTLMGFIRGLAEGQRAAED